MGMFIVRVIIGLLYLGHGLQKLAGMFGGGGLDATEKTMEHLNMHPARLQATAAGLAETAGGAALALGAATPLASAGLIATMVTAVRKVHFKNGPWNSNGGFEYNLVLIGALTALSERPGTASVDAAFGRAKWGTRWGVFAVVAGVIGSVLAVEVGKRMGPRTDPQPEEPVPDSTEG